MPWLIASWTRISTSRFDGVWLYRAEVETFSSRASSVIVRCR